MCYEVLRNSDKPALGWAMNGKQAKEYLDMIQISMGDTPRRKYWQTICQFQRKSAKSFIMVKRHTGFHDGIQPSRTRYLPASLHHGRPYLPMRPMGTIVLQNTEVLSGIVFSHLINPETPIVYTPSSTSGYMKRASYITGTPEMSLINAPLLMMAHDFYHMPSPLYVWHD